MNAFSMRRGRFVRQFDWPAAQQRHGGEPFAALALAYGALNAAADQVASESKAKLAAFRQDANLSETGRQNKVRDWAMEASVPALKRGREALKAAEAHIATLRAQMLVTGIDKTDVAAAVLRSEMRTWLRGMAPERRAALLRTGELPAEATLAILEAPAEMSGLSPEQKARLQNEALRAMHPEAAAKIDAIQEAAAAVLDAERAAGLTLQTETGVPGQDLAEILGGPSGLEALRTLDVVTEDEREPEEDA